jgi:hypothetical protein
MDDRSNDYNAHQDKLLYDQHTPHKARGNPFCKTIDLSRCPSGFQ